jgi:hypothetical protein
MTGLASAAKRWVWAVGLGALFAGVMACVPTLVTLNPVGAPIAHAGPHVSAVLHSYDTDTFLPPQK